ncbi:MAG TPA: TonB-dependent receptor [Terriglobales bacterium]|nr:TonB-dependent receptor [Terriglobales bacterium]
MHPKMLFSLRLSALRVAVSVEFCCLLFVSLLCGGQSTAPERGAENKSITITVLDENGVAVPGARIQLTAPTATRQCETDLAGRCQFAALEAGPWQLRVEKEGFYVVDLTKVQASGTLEISLNHQQEVRENVNVVESVPAIDPQQVSSQEQLSGIDILDMPYPNTRDYRYSLEYIPGVVLDQSAQPHIEGAETYETLVLLDGFNVTQPATGQLLVRPSTDALRQVRVETSRISAEHGKAPAGVLSLNTGIGDDHFRFAATNFFPSFQHKTGWAFDKVDPRFTLSGPIVKGKLWFFDGLDGEYDNVIVIGLPRNEDSDKVWRGGNIVKAQANLTSHDIVTGSFLVDWLHDDHLGMSTLAPPGTRPADSENVYVTSVKEQHTLGEDKLLEFGFNHDHYGLRQTPIGQNPYVLTTIGALGNYYLRANTTATRSQGVANFYFPGQWHGRHEFIFGTDLDHLSYDQLFARSPVSSLREGQALPPATTCLGPPPVPPNSSSCALYSVFSGAQPSSTYNSEASAYIQDRWSIIPRVLLEPGLRFDWDQIVREPLFSPRLSGTYVLDNSGNTKFSAGIGEIYQSTNLSLVALPLQGGRHDYFFDPAGQLNTSFFSTFAINRQALAAPRYVNWSVEVEHKLPAEIFLKAEYLSREGTNAFVYNTPGGVHSTNFVLQNTRHDNYRALKFDLRRTFHKNYIVSASYTRSSSTSNQVLDYSLDSLIISPQVPGPYAWDAPNRFISWGFFPLGSLPLIKHLDFAYSVEVRDGFPFAVVNQQQQLVLPPGAYRYPTYLTLNPHLEKRFHAAGFYWALRGGFENITNHQNPYTVNNILGSPQFLQFSNFDRRAFTARIRFLGRK